MQGVSKNDTTKSSFKEIINYYARRYFLDALSAMALGLFASLIIGLIMSQLGRIPYLGFLAEFSEIINSKSPVVGSAIGVAIAYGLKTAPLVVFSSAATGAFGYQLGGPVGAYIGALIGCEIGNLVVGKTKVDIVLVPLTTIIIGCFAGKFVGPYISSLMTGLGALINSATELQPLPMGILVSVIMGLCLTAPISSAAIAISLGLDGLAAGAATIGCCAQMIGFAVISYKSNGIGGFISQGIGTSMLQVPNIIRHPLIWIPPTLAGAILGPIATVVLKLTNTPLGAGMGTSGLVGQFGTFQSMGASLPLTLTILLMHFAAPAILSLIIYFFMEKAGIIKQEYYKLKL